MSAALVTFQCKLCPTSPVQGYETAWRNHLWSEAHQIKSRERLQTITLSSEHKQNLIVVFGLHEIPMKNVLSHFLEYSVVTDFTFWRNRPDLCVIEFLSVAHRNVVASSEHTILNNRVHLRLMHLIPEPEWLSICPSVATLPNNRNKKPMPINIKLKCYSELQCPSEGVSPAPPGNGPIKRRSAVDNNELSSISSDEEINSAKGEEAAEERPDTETQKEASMPPEVSSPTSLITISVDSDRGCSSSTVTCITSMQTECAASTSATIDKEDGVDQVGSQSSSTSNNANANTQESNKACSLSTVSSQSLENEEDATINADKKPVVDQFDNMKASNSDSNEVEFLCEQKKNENAPLIEINDEDDGTKNEVVVNDLETAMEKIMKCKQHLSQAEMDFMFNAKNRLELHLRLKYYSRCRLIMFTLGASLIHQHKDEILHLYLDRWGAVDERKHIATHRKKAYFMDIPDMELKDLLEVICTALKDPPADGNFIVTKVEVGVGGVVDFKYTNMEDTLRCRIHLKDFDVLQSSRLLKLYCLLDDRVEPLMNLMLQWASSRKWFGTVAGFIDQEILIWMVVFFLVYQRFVPPPCFLHEHRRIMLEALDFWYCGKLVSFTDDPKTVKILMANDRKFHPANFSVNSKGNPTARVILHLAGAVLLFYSNFDFSRFSIDLFIGQMIPKMDGCPMSMLGHPFSFKNITQYVYFPRLVQFMQNCLKSYNDVTELLKQDKAEVNGKGGQKKKTLDLVRVLHDDSDFTEWHVDSKQFPHPSKKRPRYSD